MKKSKMKNFKNEKIDEIELNKQTFLTRFQNAI